MSEAGMKLVLEVGMKMMEQQERYLARLAAKDAKAGAPIAKQEASVPMPQGKEVKEWPDEVYTYREAAARLRCSYHTIWRAVARRQIKTCPYMGGRIPASEVMRLLRGES